MLRPFPRSLTPRSSFTHKALAFLSFLSPSPSLFPLSAPYSSSASHHLHPARLVHHSRTQHRIQSPLPINPYPHSPRPAHHLAPPACRHLPSRNLAMVAPGAPVSAPWRVVVTRRVAPEAMAILRSASPTLHLDVWDSEDPIPSSELLSRIGSGADALYCMLTDKISAEVLDAGGPRLKMVSTMSVGYNHIDVAECKRRGIVIGNTPDVLTETTADTAVGLVLAACRRFKEATASVVDGTWGSWNPYGLCGPDVYGSTVGIIGLGRIGAAVARRLRAFNCRILYSGRARKPEFEEVLDATFVSLEELLRSADIVIPLCPLNESTRGMFDASKFAAMKESAVFINAARGELVNQDDLYTALSEGQIFAAGLDVTTPEPLPTDSPLIKCPNCFILPHIGSASKGTRTAMATLAARNLVAAYTGEPLPSEVKL